MNFYPRIPSKCITMEEIKLKLTNGEYRKLKKAKELLGYKSSSWEKFLVNKCSNGISVRKTPSKNNVK
jgi:hypothetical protein